MTVENLHTFSQSLTEKEVKIQRTNDYTDGETELAPFALSSHENADSNVFPLEKNGSKSTMQPSLMTSSGQDESFYSTSSTTSMSLSIPSSAESSSEYFSVMVDNIGQSQFKGAEKQQRQSDSHFQQKMKASTASIPEDKGLICDSSNHYNPPLMHDSSNTANNNTVVEVASTESSISSGKADERVPLSPSRNDLLLSLSSNAPPNTFKYNGCGNSSTHALDFTQLMKQAEGDTLRTSVIFKNDTIDPSLASAASVTNENKNLCEESSEFNFANEEPSLMEEDGVNLSQSPPSTPTSYRKSYSENTSQFTSTPTKLNSPSEPITPHSYTNSPSSHSANSQKSIHSSIQAQRLSNDSFHASILLPQATVRSVMNLISNVDLIRLWMEPILAVFVTRENERTGLDREYDGEWIEAAATLRPPSGGGSGVYTCLQTCFSYLGFQHHGNMTLFLERQRGQISITIGPIGGNCEVVHTISCHQRGNDVHLIDDVRVNRMFLNTRGEENGPSSSIAMTMMGSAASSSRLAEDRLGDLEYSYSPSSTYSSPSLASPDIRDSAQSSSISISTSLRNFVSYFCTYPLSVGLSILCPIRVQRWFLPGLEDHMNQSLQSLKNLRVLMEHGECVATIDSFYSNGTGSLENDGVTPLLGGHMI